MAQSPRIPQAQFAVLGSTVIHMIKDNVIPFRKRPAPPSQAELERYREATRNWHPEMRRRMFPEHYEIELKYADD